tara:strand:- start:919 stop:1386 length:468 start_codon:yes stop_codon:yes gene_type:complete
MAEQKKQSPVEVMENKLFDNKDNIKNGDYLIMMKALKTLNNYKSLCKITYLELNIRYDDDGDILLNYDKKYALCFINEKEISNDNTPNWWIGRGFELTECLEFMPNVQHSRGLCKTKWSKKNSNACCDDEECCSKTKDQWVMIEEKMLIKVEPLA